jgi:hypothetical protein
MTNEVIDSGTAVAAGYNVMVAKFAAAAEALKYDKSPHADTLAAAYGALAAGYSAAAAAAAQAGAMAPFPLLPLPDAAVRPSPLDVLTLAQAAGYLQLSEDAVRSEAEAGRLPGRNISGEWRFVRDSIVTWLRSPRPPLPIRSPLIDETPEEHEAFLANIRAYRDEIDRATGSGKYAPE